MKRIATIALLVSLSLIQACLGDGTGGTSGQGSLGPISLQGNVIACTEDADCTVVELGCCDTCNGGWSASVNKDYQEQVLERNHDTCTGNEVCTDMACDIALPACENGICTSRIDNWRACDTDAECTVVELGCCDHCNGGSVIATHADYAESIQQALGEECEEDYACTLMGCAPYLAKCEGGLCTAEQDPDWGVHEDAP